MVICSRNLVSFEPLTSPDLANPNCDSLLMRHRLLCVKSPSLTMSAGVELHSNTLR
jgi:hypothetical protein